MDDKSMIQKEVQKGTRYWGTRGRYVKKNQLLGFVEELGQDVESIAESILDNAIEEDGPWQPDPIGVAVVTSEVIRRTQEQDGYDYEDENEGENEGEDN